MRPLCLMGEEEEDGMPDRSTVWMRGARMLEAMDGMHRGSTSLRT